MPSGRLAAFLHHPLLELSAQRRRGERDSWPEVEASVADNVDLSGMLEKAHSAELYSVRFIYWVDGQTYSGCLKSRRRFFPGDSFPIRYNPRRPEENSTDPEEKLNTGLLVTAAATLAALYFVIALRF